MYRNDSCVKYIKIFLPYVSSDNNDKVKSHPVKFWTTRSPPDIYVLCLSLVNEAMEIHAIALIDC